MGKVRCPRWVVGYLGKCLKQTKFVLAHLIGIMTLAWLVLRHFGVVGGESEHFDKTDDVVD